MGIFRMDICKVNIKESYRSVITGVHPCLIISNWKVNIKKTGTINVIPITSNLEKYLESHVEIEGFGLDHKSKVLCNQILTINKEDLLCKIGEITDEVKINEIELALKNQLALTNKYKNVKIDKIEDIFFNNLGGIFMREDYKTLKDNILNLYIYDKDYNKSIELCNKLIRLIKEEENELLWFSYYMLALNNIKLKKYNDALENSKLMFKYLDINNITNYNISMMMLAACYLNMKQKDKAINIYKQIVSYSKKYNLYSLRIVNIWNICKINNDLSKMKRLVEILENHKWDNNQWNEDYTKQQVLQTMYIELSEALI